MRKLVFFSAEQRDRWPCLFAPRPVSALTAVKALGSDFTGVCGLWTLHAGRRWDRTSLEFKVKQYKFTMKSTRDFFLSELWVKCLVFTGRGCGPACSGGLLQWSVSWSECPAFNLHGFIFVLCIWWHQNDAFDRGKWTLTYRSHFWLILIDSLTNWWNWGMAKTT